MTWDEAFAQYTGAYETIVGIPMTPMRRMMAQTLLRNRPVDQILLAIEKIKAAAATEGKYAAGTMTKFENGSWQP